MLSAIAAHGALPLSTWDPVNGSGDQRASNPDAIVAGSQDGHIRGRTQQLAAYGGPVLLRTMEQMNASWYPNWGAGEIDPNSPHPGDA